MASLWEECLDKLEGEFSPQQFNTWIRPLHAVEDGRSLLLLAPNPFVRDWINENLVRRVREVLLRTHHPGVAEVVVQVGSDGDLGDPPSDPGTTRPPAPAGPRPARRGRGRPPAWSRGSRSTLS